MSNQARKTSQGRDGMQRIVTTEFTLPVPFQVDNGWYEAYWDNGADEPRPRLLGRVLRRIWRDALVPGAVAASGAIVGMAAFVRQRMAAMPAALLSGGTWKPRGFRG